MDGCTQVTVVWITPRPQFCSSQPFLLGLLPLFSPWEGGREKGKGLWETGIRGKEGTPKTHSPQVQVQTHNFHICTRTKNIYSGKQSYSKYTLTCL